MGPVEIENGVEGDEEGNDGEEFDADAPDGSFVDVRKHVAGGLRFAKDAFANLFRRERKQKCAEWDERPEKAAENSIPAEIFDEEIVVRVVEIEHFGVGAVVEMVALVRDADHAEGNWEKGAGEEPEPVVAAVVGLEVGVCGFVEERVVGEK